MLVLDIVLNASTLTPHWAVRGHFKDVAVVLFAKKEMMEKYHKVG